MLNIECKLDQRLFEKDLERLGLIEMRDFIREHNPSKNLPYHNTDHMEGVARVSWRLGIAHQLNEPQMIDLLTAAFWHDYDHSGGQYADSVNIARAVAHMGTSIQNHKFLKEWGSDRREIISRVTALIKVTEFPFIHEPGCGLAAILRDADLLYSFCSNAGEIALGLYKELGEAGKLEGYPSAASVLNFLNGQGSFLSSAQFYTEIGHDLRELLKRDVLALQDKAFREYAAGVKHV